MRGRCIILDHLEGREAAALMVDGHLDDFLIESDAPAPGTIYRARADRPVKGQGGMFLTVPGGSAFLRQVKGLAPGQLLLVQVTGYAEPGKAIPVTQKLLFKSRYAIITPGTPGLNLSRSIRDDAERDRLLEIAHDTMEGAPFGLILRSSCDGADQDEIAEDIARMAELAGAVLDDTGTETETLLDGDGPHALAWRDWTAPAEIVTEAQGFADHGVLDALTAACGPVEPLAGGGRMFIEPTRALIAVDVNTGPDSSLAAGIKANLACARALPRALRVRGLGGQITLDLAPMPKKDRRSFETALRAAFRSDSEETALVGWTPLGHYELQRKRGRTPLDGVLT
ncbi:ribonuclease E/G [Sedimentitalea todarodis]|uniref:Ribonuclease E/G n=1 Tax=Sedimentitalea todarodis TaxID=1631240 RepID=A0ABU3VGG3_9RHOB|nr:ribonuclease E/G [Sedimentitalea todarodis]MDU9005274.1 ribonuclease E/G [Sedimentitalea todarodis]